MAVERFQLNCVARQNEQLAELVASTAYSRAEFDRARKAIDDWRKNLKTIEPIELARLLLILVRQSFSASGRWWSTSTFDGENRPQLWAKLPYVIRRCLERLRGVYLEQQDYLEILTRYDHERAAFYLDPPYEGVESQYYEVNSDGFDHEALRNAVEDLKGFPSLTHRGVAGSVEWIPLSSDCNH